ncbi:MAG: hypothetical protein FJ207_14515 [Gemmatimonadetes bacterium]|nr:hypothetical protein [Gemmatimonadota bacterium]
MRIARVLFGLAAWAAFASAPASAQADVFGGQERQFADHWSDWPNGYVASTLAPKGQPLIPLFEGWYPNPDGTYDLAFDYMNLNLEQTFHIPIGPDNFLEPARYNGMQPTFFMPAPARGREGEQRHYRHQSTFVVNVPATFGQDEDVVWTLRYDGKTVKVPGRIRVSSYRLENLEGVTSAPLAATMRLGASGPEGRGRSGPIAPQPLRARVGQPIELSTTVTPLTGEQHTVFWFDHQGPAAVSFDPQQAPVPGTGGSATTRATFSQPGDYMVRVTALQTLAAMVQHCCYTNGYVRVTVTP